MASWTKQNGIDTLTAAVEGGIGYWSIVTDCQRDPDGGWLNVTLLPEVDCEVPESGFTYDTPVMVSALMMRKARERILEGGIVNAYIMDMVRPLGDDYDIDAEGADCIVQVAIFGTLVFG